MKNYRHINAILLSSIITFTINGCPAEITNDTDELRVVILDEWEDAYVVPPKETVEFGSKEKRARFFLVGCNNKRDTNPTCQRYVKQIACGATKEMVKIKVSAILNDDLGPMFEITKRMATSNRQVKKHRKDKSKRVAKAKQKKK